MSTPALSFTKNQNYGTYYINYIETDAKILESKQRLNHRVHWFSLIHERDPITCLINELTGDYVGAHIFLWNTNIC